jgi:hypothetical protein
MRLDLLVLTELISFNIFKHKSVYFMPNFSMLFIPKIFKVIIFIQILIVFGSGYFTTAISISNKYRQMHSYILLNYHFINTIRNSKMLHTLKCHRQEALCTPSSSVGQKMNHQL